MPNAAGIVEWQVIEFADSQVQSGSVSFAATDSVRTATMRDVDTAKSWLIYTYKTDAGTAANIGQKLLQGLISNGTTLIFDRANIGQAMALTWYLVEFTDGTTVRRGPRVSERQRPRRTFRFRLLTLPDHLPRAVISCGEADHHMPEMTTQE